MQFQIKNIWIKDTNLKPEDVHRWAKANNRSVVASSNSCVSLESNEKLKNWASFSEETSCGTIVVEYECEQDVNLLFIQADFERFKRSFTYVAPDIDINGNKISYCLYALAIMFILRLVFGLAAVVKNQCEKQG